MTSTTAGDIRVAFVSTRIAGTDGVSLEIEKWAHVLERSGVSCFYITGESDRPAERTALVEEAHFNHPDIQAISDQVFGREKRSRALDDEIMRLTRLLRDAIAEALERFRIDAIIPENALTIPMNIPLGLAIVQVLQQTPVGCLAHHHDFYWERDRFLVNSVDDYLRYAFPPALPQIQHVTINSPQAEEFCRRTGQSCRIIPNVMDFANPPPPADDYARTFRSVAGFAEDDLIVLQPTRVVPRKGIEHSVELLRRMELPNARLVVSHEFGDEGDDYLHRIREYAELLGVDLRFVSQHIAQERGVGATGSPLFTLNDVFSQADLVAYPSEYEGFGNAFLEAVYHRKPIVCNRYTIYRMDIEPCGFQTVLFDGYLRPETIEHVHRVLNDEEYRAEMVNLNYEIASQYFSYEALEAELRLIIERPHNIYRLIGRGRRSVRKDIALPR